MQKIANKESNTIEILIEDLNQHFTNNMEIIERIKKNTKRYVSLFYQIIDELLPERTTERREEEQDTVAEIFLR